MRSSVGMATSESIRGVKLGITAIQERRARLGHLWSKSELLTVQNQCVLILVDFVLRLSTSVLHIANLALSICELLFDRFMTYPEIFLIGTNPRFIGLNFVRNCIDVVGEVGGGGFECF